MVKQLFSNCKEPDQINPQPGSYNPAKFGRAYYFTPHGNQLREIPKYTMDKISHNSNYDDEPARAEEKCNKNTLKWEGKVQHTCFSGLTRSIMVIAMDII
ncbi:hypothetical protein ACJMK2_025974 [Sinanodonta woodiana]|uniref:Uncharacterized protein n=1 Tax=Sinanodonta woodiana TaxID=1069815 RepID=A0ABD3XLX2_SINWO